MNEIIGSPCLLGRVPPHWIVRPHWACTCKMYFYLCSLPWPWRSSWKSDAEGPFKGAMVPWGVGRHSLVLLPVRSNLYLFSPMSRWSLLAWCYFIFSFPFSLCLWDPRDGCFPPDRLCLNERCPPRHWRHCGCPLPPTSMQPFKRGARRRRARGSRAALLLARLAMHSDAAPTKESKSPVSPPEARTRCAVRWWCRDTHV